MQEKEKIELRSEKVRHIIKEMPSSIVRYGIMTVTLIVLGLLSAAYFIPYPETVSAKAIVLDDKQITISLSYKYVNTIKKGMKVNVELEGYDAETYGYKTGQIMDIDNIPKAGKFTAIVEVNIGRYRMMTGMVGSASILTTNKSILERILQRIIHSD